MDTSARAQRSSSLSISTIGEDLSIVEVTSEGALHLDDQVQGDVRCAALVLGENAQLEGSVVVEEVLVRGRLIDSVRALRVTEDSLSASSEVPRVEPQSNHNGRLDDENQGGSLKGFIRALPESCSA
jgi:hypothetical protein